MAGLGFQCSAVKSALSQGLWHLRVLLAACGKEVLTAPASWPSCHHAASSRTSPVASSIL